MFIDYVKIHCRSGRGGAGSAYMRREKFIPKGGPAGGDGGRGGHVIVKGNEQLWTLLPLKYRKHVRAAHGQPGGSNQKHGRDGGDVLLEVPLGTIVKDAETGVQLGEISEHGQEMTVMEGGKGGRGNVHFKSATRQTPRYAQPGIPEQEGWVILELKLLADVGLVGFPNAGKSTLLSVLSAAKPAIADYPFTTLTPHLGMVAYRDFQSFVMADIPGIIEGAHQGKGLGLRFLRHIERNAVLLFVVPSDTDDIRKAHRILLGELAQYNPELMDKPQLLAISKADLIDEVRKKVLQSELPPIPHCFISSVSQTGLTKLKDLIWRELTATA